jgi:hypothetical protein
VAFVKEEGITAIAIDGGPIRESEALARVRLNSETLEHCPGHERIDGAGVHEELDCFAPVSIGRIRDLQTEDRQPHDGIVQWLVRSPD